MDEAHKTDLVELTAEIISAYVSNNTVVPESLPSVINEADIRAGRQHGEAQFFCARALECVVEGKGVPKNRTGDVRTQRRHSDKMLCVKLFSE